MPDEQIQIAITAREDAARVLKAAQGDVKELSGAATAAGGSFGRLGQSMGGVAGVARTLGPLLGAAGLAGGLFLITRTLKGAITSFAEFDRKLAEIAALSGRISEREIRGLEKAFNRLASETGKSRDKIAAAFFDIKSATGTIGLTGAQQLQVLAQALRLSEAGFTDVNTATNILLTAFTTFGRTTSDLAKISDILFTIAQGGRTTFGELAQSFGNVIPVGKAAGLSLEELGASLAVITTALGQTDKSVVALLQAIIGITKLGDPTPELRQALDRFGITVRKTKSGTVDFLDTVRQFKGLNLGQVRELILEQNAALGIIALANGFSQLNAQLAIFPQNAGTVLKLSDELRQRTGAQLKQSTESAGAALETFGRKLSETGVVGGALSFFTQGIQGLTLALDKLSPPPAVDELGQAIDILRGKLQALIDPLTSFVFDPRLFDVLIKQIRELEEEQKRLNELRRQGLDIEAEAAARRAGFASVEAQKEFEVARKALAAKKEEEEKFQGSVIKARRALIAQDEADVKRRSALVKQETEDVLAEVRRGSDFRKAFRESEFDAERKAAQKNADEVAQITREQVADSFAELRRLSQESTQRVIRDQASAVRALADQIGLEPAIALAKELGDALNENVIPLLRDEIPDQATRALNAQVKMFRESQKAAEEFSRRTASFLTNTLFLPLEGRAQSFGQFIKNTFLNLGKEIVESQIFALLNPRGGGGTFPFGFRLGGGGAGAIAAAGLPLVAGAPLGIGAIPLGPGAVALNPSAAIGAAGGGVGGIGTIGTALSGISKFIGSPFLSFRAGGISAIGPGGGQLGAGFSTALGVTPLGALGAGFAGAGIGGLVGGGGVASQVLGGLGGVGGLIGGTAIAASLATSGSIAATGALAGSVIPGIGTVIGAVLGGFLGGLFGGGPDRDKVQRNSIAISGQIAPLLSNPQLAAFTRDHPILGRAFEAEIRSLTGLRFRGLNAIRRQKFFSQMVIDAFNAGLTPENTFAEMTFFSAAFGESFVNTGFVGAGLRVLAGRSLAQVLADERTIKRAELLGPGLTTLRGTLFETEFGELGIRGLAPLAQAGVLPEGIMVSPTTSIGGIEQVRVKRSRMEAIQDLSTEEVEALLRKLIGAMRSLGLEFSNLAEVRV